VGILFEKISAIISVLHGLFMRFLCTDFVPGMLISFRTVDFLCL